MAQRNTTRYIAAGLAALLLSGCARIPADSFAESGSASDSSSRPEGGLPTDPDREYVDIPVTKYEFDDVETLIKLNAEGGVTDGDTHADGEFDGSGYVSLEEGMTITHMAEIPYSQHYRVVIAARSYAGAAIKLSFSDTAVGNFYLPPSEGREFEFSAVDNLYIANGPLLLRLVLQSGEADIDYIYIESSDELSSDCYRTGLSPISPNSSIEAIGLMKYLASGYGSRIVTGQNVTIGSNREIELIRKETGRYPAMRCSDLAPATRKDETSAKAMEADIALALDWGGKGGIVSYAWHWYSPNIYESTGHSSFDLKSAIGGQSIPDIAMANEEQLTALVENGFASDRLVAMIEDIDTIAAILKRFADVNIPVVFQPIPDNDTELFWWGGDEQCSTALWQLIFTRICSYHGLGNLIWVWNGSDARFYPGDKLCDIIGQGFYEKSAEPFAGRLAALARISPTSVKAGAITSCDKLPSPDKMFRDNAMWMWFAVGSGESFMNGGGGLSETCADRDSLYNAFNCEICDTLDELPNFKKLAMS